MPVKINGTMTSANNLVIPIEITHFAKYKDTGLCFHLIGVSALLASTSFEPKKSLTVSA